MSALHPNSGKQINIGIWIGHQIFLSPKYRNIGHRPFYPKRPFFSVKSVNLDYYLNTLLHLVMKIWNILFCFTETALKALGITIDMTW